MFINKSLIRFEQSLAPLDGDIMGELENIWVAEQIYRN